MSLATLIRTADELVITGYVLINGQLAPEVLGVDVTLGLMQHNGQATLHVVEKPSWAATKASVQVMAGYNGDVRLLFTGELTALSWDAQLNDAHTVGLGCITAMNALDRPYGGDDLTFTTGQTDGDIIEALLGAYGLTDRDIQDSGWTPVQIQDIVFSAGTSAWSLIERLDLLSGYKTFLGPDGRIYRRRISGAPAPAPAWTMAENVDILTISRQQDITSSDIANGAIFTGLSWEGTDISGSEGPIPNSDLDHDQIKTLQDDLLQLNDDAANAAQIYVADHNRKNESLAFEVLGNPLIWSGMTIQATHSEIGQSSVLALIDQVHHTIDLAQSSYVTNGTTTGGNLSGYDASAPQVVITLQLIAEAEDDGMTVTETVVMLADGSGSFSPQAEEDTLTYAMVLSATGGTPSPASGAVVKLAAVVAGDITNATAELTVTDPYGLSTTTSVTKANTTATRLRQDLYLAVDTDAECSTDGERAWPAQALTGGATTGALMPIAPSWGQIWAGSDGHLYATFDNLATPLVDLGQPMGTSTTLTACWAHELDDTRLWATNSAGAVAFGVLDVDAQTVEWTVMTALPEGPVIEIRESYTTYGALRATAGAGYYRSEDGANSWALLDTGDTARRMAAGFGYNFYSFLNDDAPLREESGLAIMLPVLDPVIRHIRALTVGWRSPILYAADDQARLLMGPITDSGVTMAHVATNAAGVNHMIRAGAGIDPDKIYLACGDGSGGDGLYSWIPGISGADYLARSHATTPACAMVGVGALHGPETTIQAMLLRPTWGISPGGVYLKESTADTAALKNSGLPSGFYWGEARFSPLSTDVWALMGNSSSGGGLYPDAATGEVLCGDAQRPLWMTTTRGASFMSVPIYWTHYTDYAWATTTPISWDSRGRLVLALGRDDGGGGYIILWRDDPTLGAGLHTQSAPIHGIDYLWQLAMGAGGQVIAVARDAGRPHYIPASTLTLLPSGVNESFRAHFGQPGWTVEVLAARLAHDPDSLPTTIYADTRDNSPVPGFFASLDYTAIYPEQIDAGAITPTGLAATTDGVYFTRGRRSSSGSEGIYRLGDPLGTPTPVLVAASGISIVFLRASEWLRGSRSLLVAHAEDSPHDLYIYDGAQWVEDTAWPATTYSSVTEIAAVEVVA